MIGVCPVCNSEKELVEAISSEEIVSVCRNCAISNGMPIIQRPTNEQIQNTQKFVSHKERVEKFMGKSKSKTPEVDNELKKIIAHNVKAGEYPKLVDNFHWVIMHARRMKKISQKQLGEAIAEPEVLIEMAEKAKLPDNYDRLIIKLEQFLGIKLRREDTPEKKELDFKKINPFEVKTSDLKKMQAEKTDEDGDFDVEDEDEVIDIEKED